MTTAVTISMSAADWRLILRSVRRDASTQRVLGWEQAAVLAREVGDRLDASLASTETGVGEYRDGSPTVGAAREEGT
jgi:hypothetical protein